MAKVFLYSIIFIVGFVGVSLWGLWLVIHPPKIVLNRTPADFNLPAKEITITSSDNTKLSAWLVESEDASKKVLLLLHGYPAEKGDMLSIASSLYPDFSLLLLDLRYFGKSEGAYTTLGVKEKDDVKAAISFLEEQGYEEIGIFGFSLGGAIALSVAAEDDRIDAVSSYASFGDIRQLGYETYRNILILKYPLVELMILWSKPLFGAAVTSVSPMDAAAKMTIPVFIIHTQQDDQIDFSHAERLKEALSGNTKAEFYFPERGLHGELPVDFNERLKEFFKKSL